MNNIPMKTNSISLLPTCWLYQNKHYLYVGSRYIERLPLLSKNYESVLEDLKIPYRTTYDELLEYWDPSNYEEEELTLPLYISLADGSYRFAKNHTGKIPSTNSIVAAKKLIQKVDKAVKAFDLELITREHILTLKDLLHGRKAAGFTSVTLRYHENDFVTKEDHLKVLPVKKIVRAGFSDSGKSPTGCFVVFNVNKIELNSELDLQVPKGQEGLFIGKGGWQIKEWCEQLGLKKINIVGI